MCQLIVQTLPKAYFVKAFHCVATAAKHMLCTCEPLNKQKMLGVCVCARRTFLLALQRCPTGHFACFKLDVVVTHLLFEAARLVERSKASTEPVNANAL